MPYLALTIYFFTYQYEPFFLKTRSSVQFLFVLMALALVIVQLIIWNSHFYEYSFLNFSIQEADNQNLNQIKTKTTALIAVIASIGAAIGWVFTSRVQIINAIKGHTMQVLMNSRTSSIYAEKVDEAMKLRKKLQQEFEDEGKAGTKLELTKERYEKLDSKERSAVHYLLNFLEFVAVGIRHYTLDEEFIKGSLRSILNSNYRLFHPVIEHLRKTDNHTVYNQIELLHKRWDDAHHEKCGSCNKWHKLAESKTSLKEKYRFQIHITMALITCGFWLFVVLVMWALSQLTDKHTIKSSYICDPCKQEP